MFHTTRKTTQTDSNKLQYFDYTIQAALVLAVKLAPGSRTLLLVNIHTCQSKMRFKYVR